MNCIVEKKIFFSIGIPAFKAKYLKECIQSILDQNYDNFELIIVNDSSPEDLETIMSSFSDSRIQYHRNDKNFGAEHVVDNWNRCLSFAKGDFFILMGDDDRMEPTYLEEFLSLIIRYPELDVFHCQSYIINENSERINITTACPEFESAFENIWHRTNSLRQQYVSDFVYRTTVLNNNGGFYKLPLAWGSDDITAYIAMGKKGIAHLNNPVFNYRRNSLTISSTGNFKLKMESISKVHNWLLDFLENNVSTEKDLVLQKYLYGSIPKYTQKRKIQTMTSSYFSGCISFFIFWNFNREKYKITFIEILYALLEFAKAKLRRNRYL